MPSDNLSMERRGARRVPIVIPVELADERGFLLHSTSDLSVGGAFFAMAIPNAVGSRVKITLRPPGLEPIRCEGEVANVPDAKQYGMGVRFVNLSDTDQARLEAFIRSQEKPVKQVKQVKRK